jgi:hypothetical protein
MKKLLFLCTLLSSGLLFSQKDRSANHTADTIVIDGQNGRLILQDDFKNNLIFVKKGKPIHFKVTNLLPGQSANITVTQSYQNSTNEMTISNPIEKPTDKSLPESGADLKETSDKISSLKEKIESKENAIETAINNENSSKKALNQLLISGLKLEVANLEIQKNAMERKRDSLNTLTVLFKGEQGLKQTYFYAQTINTSEAKRSALGAIKKEIDSLELHLAQSKVMHFPNLKTTADQLLTDMWKLYGQVSTFQPDYYKTVTPRKEQVEVTIEQIENSSSKITTKSLNEFHLVTIHSFKMFASAGFHVIVNDGADVRHFHNRGGTIEDRRGDNVLPSFGTYIQGAWRFRDGLAGFGFGTGIPFNSSETGDLSPNFALFGTLVFQTDAGRFGLNIGTGLRKVNYLSPGYNVGDQLVDAEAIIPTYSRWKPGLMVGINYTIPEQKK